MFVRWQRRPWARRGRGGQFSCLGYVKLGSLRSWGGGEMTHLVQSEGEVGTTLLWMVELQVMEEGVARSLRRAKVVGPCTRFLSGV